MTGSLDIDLSQFLASASLALDAVESEVLGVAGNHSRKVAYLAVRTGQRLGMSTKELSDIAACSLLHDNALTEYATLRRNQGQALPREQIKDDFAYHCIAGEKNINVFPFYGRTDNVITYHHENYDGSGIFGIRGENIPLMSRIIRIADNLDTTFNLSGNVQMPEMRRYIEENSGVLFDSAVVRAFLPVLSETVEKSKLLNDNIMNSIAEAIPGNRIDMSYEDIINISSFFAHIVDYKSPFTLSHSSGIAEKTWIMTKYYDFDEDRYNQLYIAAFFHDIGKLAIPDTLLEKPGKLTPAEFEVVKSHVWYTHKILSVIDSFDKIEKWASSHHERLDGSGYFRGSKGDEQDFCSRILECIDVYQALVEDRPYRKGMANDQALYLLKQQAAAGQLDKFIVADIEKVFA